MHIPRFTAPPPPLPSCSAPAHPMSPVMPPCLPPVPQELPLLPPVCLPNIKPCLTEAHMETHFYTNFQKPVSNPSTHPPPTHPFGLTETFNNPAHCHPSVESLPRPAQPFCYAPVKIPPPQQCPFETVQVAVPHFHRSEHPQVTSNCLAYASAEGHFHPVVPNISSISGYQGNVACESFPPRYPHVGGPVNESIGNPLALPVALKYNYMTELNQRHNEYSASSSNVMGDYYHKNQGLVNSEERANKYEKESKGHGRKISPFSKRRSSERNGSRRSGSRSRRSRSKKRRSVSRNRRSRSSESRRKRSGSRRSRISESRRKRSESRGSRRIESQRMGSGRGSSRSGSRKERSGSRRKRSGSRKSDSKRSGSRRRNEIREQSSGSRKQEGGSKYRRRRSGSLKRSRDRNQIKSESNQVKTSETFSSNQSKQNIGIDTNSDYPSKEKPRNSRDSPNNTSVTSKAGHNSKSHNVSPHSSSVIGTKIKAHRSSPRHSTAFKKDVDSEREILLKKWRQSYCATSQEMQEKLEALAKMTPEEIIEAEKKVWTRAAPADLFYITSEINHTVKVGTPLLSKLCDEFYEKLVLRAEKVRATQVKIEMPAKKQKKKFSKHTTEHNSSDSSSGSSTDEEEYTMEELKRKSQHPYRLHPELWFNDPGEMNDGPLCRCSAKARRCGIRHGIYSGESNMKRCDPSSNNANNLHHYRITISPPTNFLIKTPTIIKHDGHEFIFEGFSMLSHYPLTKLPTCKVIRFNIEYTILYVEEKLPDNFIIRQLDLFYEFLFQELLELVDLDFKAHGDENGCPQFHFMPRFVRDLQDNGKEILSMNVVMQYLVNNSGPLFEESSLEMYMKMPQFDWQNFADEIKGMVVAYPGMKPCSLRVDQLDRDQHAKKSELYPEIVHFGVRPPQLSYAGNPEYQKAWREYVKFRHLLANMPKPSFEDKRKLESKEMKLQEMRTQSRMKRDVTVAVSARGFHRTGIMCDVVQHAMLIPVLVCHLRFHRSCNTLEEVIDYKFQNRYLLQLALTHPSYRENFGTNPDHARNTLTNCGIRQPEYGDRRIHYMNTRKRGINTLINIMSRFGKTKETGSNIIHNERLEFLGDAVVEFLTSIHLFHMLPNVEEGGLATFRAALVQNQHLAVLAKTLNLDAYMLYAHGSDLCHDLELRHAMANCFEALMGALFLDGGIKVPDKVFGNTKFNNPELRFVWFAYPLHPLQQQELSGDRHWIESHRHLQKLTEFEDAIGVKFNHIRLLARAFTDRSVGYTNLTQGSNQRLEFLGDTVLQLVASEYLYRFFPEHHEGHLSLLRSSLVNNRTQAVVCNDLGMTKFAVYSRPKVELKTKDRADLLEAFLGALYVDKGLKYCGLFCDVCFFPRLQDFIMNQDWNDPKSKLQQCCLTLRSMDGGEPDIPIYKVIECKGPTNTREYTVAVYFRQKRLAKACGHSIQMAEMNAARKALENSKDLFPQLDHQKRVIAKSVKKQHAPLIKPDNLNQLKLIMKDEV